MRTFEDFTPGLSETYGPRRVSKEDIISFARAFDPQPFHLGEEEAKGTFVGRLIASGWHTCAINMRLIADGFLLGAASRGAPGIEEVKWVRPVYPGDALRSRMSVLEARASRSRPELGLVHFLFEMLNDKDEIVLEQRNWIMFGRRGAPPVIGAPHVPAAAAATPPPLPEPAPRIDYLEDLVVGETTELGGHLFSAEEIVAYARQFDPQPFHVDAEAAKRSLFGGLCASGWHTAAVWMKLLHLYRDRLREACARGGVELPALGPSPGFKNLVWAKPVYAGDTVRFRSTAAGTRTSASRPGWGLAFQRNTGINQHGEEVFAFDGAAFWRRRPS